MICGLCKSEEMKYLLPMPDNNDIERNIHQCQICHALTAEYDHRPNVSLPEQISLHEDMWSQSKLDEVKHDVEQLEGLVDALHPFLGKPGPRNKVLEIGCGRGTLLKALVQKGYAAHGCEPAERLVAVAREHLELGPDVLTHSEFDSFVQLPQCKAPYKSVIFWHVIEHLDNPMSAFHAARRLLSNSGSIIIQLPLLWKNYIFSEHYFFATHNTFSFIAKNIKCGIESIIYDDENLHVTAIFNKKSKIENFDFFNMENIPNAIMQLLFIIRKSRNDYKRLYNEMIYTR